MHFAGWGPARLALNFGRWRPRRLLAALAAALPLASAGTTALPGTVVAIGGALAEDNAAVWGRLVAEAGGAGAPWVVIGTASNDPAAAARRTADRLRRHGAEAEPLALVDASAADDEALAARVRSARGVFLTGGDQSRLTALLRPAATDPQGESRVLQALRAVLAGGGVVAGTSAGAAVASVLMFTGGDPLQVLQHGARPHLAPGLGFVHADLLVDQHFVARGRLGRLLPALLLPDPVPHGLPRPVLGLGVDEDSAAVIRGHQLEVLGRAGVLVIDVRQATPPPPQGPWATEGVRLHWLSHGDRMDLASGTLSPAPERLAAEDRGAAPAVAGRRAAIETDRPDVLAPAALLQLLRAAAEGDPGPLQGVAGQPPGPGNPSGGPVFRFSLTRTTDTRGWSADGRFSLQGVVLTVSPAHSARPADRP